MIKMSMITSYLIIDFELDFLILKRGQGGQRLLGVFLEIHPFLRDQASLNDVTILLMK